MKSKETYKDLNEYSTKKEIKKIETFHKELSKIAKEHPEKFLFLNEKITKHLGWETAYIAAELKQCTYNKKGKITLKNAIEIIKANHEFSLEKIINITEDLIKHKYIILI